MKLFLSQQSIKFKVTPIDYNATIFSFLGVALPPPLLESSTYVGCCISCAVIEYIRLYLYVLEFLINLQTHFHSIYKIWLCYTMEPYFKNQDYFLEFNI